MTNDNSPWTITICSVLTSIKFFVSTIEIFSYIIRICIFNNCYKIAIQFNTQLVVPQLQGCTTVLPITHILLNRQDKHQHRNSVFN